MKATVRLLMALPGVGMLVLIGVREGWWTGTVWAPVWVRLTADFWPVDASRIAPNIVASAVQALIVGFVMWCLWPAFRRATHRWVDAKLHEHLKPIHDRLDRHSDKLEAIHKHVKGEQT